MPQGESGDLFRLYAVLLRAKGVYVTQSDVHDVWSFWMAKRDPTHHSLVAYEQLTEAIRREDLVFANAIRRASDQIGQRGSSRPLFIETLFPSGTPENGGADAQLLELYKIIVESSEELVSRRQGVNTFFLTMNGALLTAGGIIIQSSGDESLSSIGILVLTITGTILCGAWRSLIRSFGQLNRGKFKVINTMERYLKAAIF